MHSNISLRYLPGTGMYFRYFWLLWGPYFFCRGFRRARNRGFFVVTASFLGCFRSPVKLLCIQCIQIIFWGNYQVLAYISRVFATFEIHTGSVWASKRAWNWAFLPFLGSGPDRGRSSVEWPSLKPEAGWLAGPQTWLAGPQTWLDGPEGGNGRMDKWTDKQTENLPILPYRGHCPASPLEN